MSLTVGVCICFMFGCLVVVFSFCLSEMLRSYECVYVIAESCVCRLFLRIRCVVFSVCKLMYVWFFGCGCVVVKPHDVV